MFGYIHVVKMPNHHHHHYASEKYQSKNEKKVKRTMMMHDVANKLKLPDTDSSLLDISPETFTYSFVVVMWTMIWLCCLPSDIKSFFTLFFCSRQKSFYRNILKKNYCTDSFRNTKWIFIIFLEYFKGVRTFVLVVIVTQPGRLYKTETLTSLNSYKLKTEWLSDCWDLEGININIKGDANNGLQNGL